MVCAAPAEWHGLQGGLRGRGKSIEAGFEAPSRASSSVPAPEEQRLKHRGRLPGTAGSAVLLHRQAGRRVRVGTVPNRPEAGLKLQAVPGKLHPLRERQVEKKCRQAPDPRPQPRKCLDGARRGRTSKQKLFTRRGLFVGRNDFTLQLETVIGGLGRQAVNEPVPSPLRRIAISGCARYERSRSAARSN